MRSFLVLILVGTLGFLAGCGSSGTPVGVVTSITLTPSSASVDAGQSVNITASVANDSSGKGVSWSLTGAGTLSSQTTTGVTYTAPNPVTSISLPSVVATSIASSSVTASTPIVIAPAGTVANVAPISVDGGPLVPSTIYTNAAFVSVLLCAPSNGACQTIPNILVDTGSFGLRVLASEVTVPLSPLTDTNGNTLYDCVQFVDNSFLWGAVAPANIVVGAELAASTSVQIIANPSFSIPSGCSGTNEDTQLLLGANGILGVGPEPFDCGLACDPSAGGTAPAVYYLCGSGGSCSTTFVSCGALCSDANANQQVTNPVFNFPADNNGTILTLQAVNDVAATVPGSLTFGIGTESNNALPSTATLFTLNSADNFTTNFNGQALTGSFIDSGSNGIFFPQINNLPNICADNNSWYCPPTTTAYTATNVDPNNNSTSNTVNFSVDNFDTVTNANPNDAAFSNLAGPMGSGACSSSNTTACTFDWGLPFFYGRSVFTAIDGTTTPNGNGPFWAY
ncbi:MAG TPA: DUF3443 family protein [Terriglobales bacterium]|nr:DUF3443 family protein [Terriglobales bacterium]